MDLALVCGPSSQDEGPYSKSPPVQVRNTARQHLQPLPPLSSNSAPSHQSLPSMKDLEDIRNSLRRFSPADAVATVATSPNFPAFALNAPQLSPRVAATTTTSNINNHNNNSATTNAAVTGVESNNSSSNSHACTPCPTRTRPSETGGKCNQHTSNLTSASSATPHQKLNNPIPSSISRKYVPDLQIVREKCQILCEFAECYGPSKNMFHAQPSEELVVQMAQHAFDVLEIFMKIRTDKMNCGADEDAIEYIRKKRNMHAPAVRGRQRKRAKRPEASPPNCCRSCGISDTPEWRRGPDGARTLCNACGLHYAKLTKKRAQESKPRGEPTVPLNPPTLHHQGDYSTPAPVTATPLAAAPAAPISTTPLGSGAATAAPPATVATPSCHVHHQTFSSHPSYYPPPHEPSQLSPNPTLPRNHYHHAGSTVTIEPAQPTTRLSTHVSLQHAPHRQHSDTTSRPYHYMSAPYSPPSHHGPEYHRYKTLHNKPPRAHQHSPAQLQVLSPSSSAITAVSTSHGSNGHYPAQWHSTHSPPPPFTSQQQVTSMLSSKVHTDTSAYYQQRQPPPTPSPSASAPPHRHYSPSFSSFNQGRHHYQHAPTTPHSHPITPSSAGLGLVAPSLPVPSSSSSLSGPGTNNPSNHEYQHQHQHTMTSSYASGGGHNNQQSPLSPEGRQNQQNPRTTKSSISSLTNLLS